MTSLWTERYNNNNVWVQIAQIGGDTTKPTLIPYSEHKYQAPYRRQKSSQKRFYRQYYANNFLFMLNATVNIHHIIHRRDKQKRVLLYVFVCVCVLKKGLGDGECEGFALYKDN